MGAKDGVGARLGPRDGPPARRRDDNTLQIDER